MAGYVVLDDDQKHCDACNAELPAGHVVQTLMGTSSDSNFDPEAGLTVALARLALESLNKDDSRYDTVGNKFMPVRYERTVQYQS